jgi:hypothetical protein
MTSFYAALGFIGTAASFLLVVFLLRSGFRRHLVLLAYALVHLASNAVEEWVYHDQGIRSIAYRNVYWTDEVVKNLLLFLLVIHMTYRASEGSPLRASAVRILSVVTAVAVLLPFLVFQPPYFTTPWFRHSIQLLEFCATIMNLVLWTVLIATRRRDPQLLTISAGLGVGTTGAAIAYGLREWFTGDARLLANLVGNLTYLGSTLIWCWAFRPKLLSSRPQNGARELLTLPE